MAKITKKYRQMAEIYLKFSLMKGNEQYNSYRDSSEEAMFEAYSKETYGDKFDIRRENGKINAYIEGKQWMDLTLTEYWLPDLQNGELIPADLYDDFPKWFLDKVLPERYKI